jgi:cytochrome c-type biogenesis protein CcmH
MRSLTCAALTFVILLAPTNALASPQDQANDLSGEIMSPFCPGVTLHECPSAEAIQLRDRIAGWFAAGQSRSEIMQRLEDEYGVGIRAAPGLGGSGLAAWLLPVIALLIGVGVAVVLLRRWTRAPQATVADAVVAPLERERVDAELAGLRGPR